MLKLILLQNGMIFRVELFDVEDEPVLNRIKIDHPGDSDQCTAEMLRLWLEKYSDATWNQLIQTFREPNIKLETLALKIEGLLSKGKASCSILMYMYVTSWSYCSNSRELRNFSKKLI